MNFAEAIFAQKHGHCTDLFAALLGKATSVSELPDGYKRVKSLTMDNDCYYEIEDFYLKGSDTVKLSYSITGACNVFGCYTNASAQDNYSLYVQSSSSSKYLRYADGAYNSCTKLNTRYDVEITPTGTHGMETNSVWEEASFTSVAEMLIGTTSVSASSAKLKGTLYGNIIVKDANGIRFKGIPCVRLSDDVAGYYDTVSETFYEPNGTNPTVG